jgi:exodeoxyribonuclease VII small subunit
MTRDKERIQSALERLEKIVAQLGQDDVDVETGLEKFREGVALIKYLRSRLQKAENEFLKLKQELESGSAQDDSDEKQEMTR